MADNAPQYGTQEAMERVLDLLDQARKEAWRAARHAARSNQLVRNAGDIAAAACRKRFEERFLGTNAGYAEVLVSTSRSVAERALDRSSPQDIGGGSSVPLVGDNERIIASLGSVQLHSPIADQLDNRDVSDVDERRIANPDEVGRELRH